MRNVWENIFFPTLHRCRKRELSSRPRVSLGAMACNSILRFKSPTFVVRRARGRIYYLSQVRRVKFESHHPRSGNSAQPMTVNAFKSVRLTPPPCHPYSRPSIYFDFWSVTVKMPLNKVNHSKYLIHLYLKHSS